MIGIAPQVGDDRALEEHERPVGDCLHLLGVAGHDEAGDPGAGEGVDLTVDVDAQRRRRRLASVRRGAARRRRASASVRSTTFCWFPPLRTRTARPQRRRGDLHLARSTDDLFAFAPGGQDRQERPSRVFHGDATLTLQRTLSSGNKALSMRLSGTMPIRAAAAVERSVDVRDHRRCGSRPASHRVSPQTTRAISAWPDPIEPYSATISPPPNRDRQCRGETRCREQRRSSDHSTSSGASPTIGEREHRLGSLTERQLHQPIDGHPVGAPCGRLARCAAR